jgi:hypothetical protein
MSCAAAGSRVPPVALNAMLVWELAWTGCQVAEYAPVWPSPRNDKGGSPFEKLATTEPFSTAAPQSSWSKIISVSGQAAGTAKLLTKPVSVRTSLLAEQLAAWALET